MTADLTSPDRRGAPADATAVEHRPRPRSALRSVVVPTEHGGWGLTLEPVLLGLIVGPSLSGVGLGLGAVVMFLARTPLKVLLVDVHRHRRLDRTRLTRWAIGCYALALGACVAVPLVRAPARTWLPLTVMAPLVGTELWFDMRSRGRRLIPELAGAIGIAGVAAMMVFAAGRPTATAVACWALLSARAVTAITTVRDQVRGLHGRRRQPMLVLVGDVGALSLAAVAVLVEPAAMAGAAAVGALVVTQRLLRLRPTPRAVILGLTQTGLGLVLVGITALGLTQG
jgi:hypothetical protein